MPSTKNQIKCNCISEVNKMLEAQNLKLDTLTILNASVISTLYINTTWLDPDKKIRGKNQLK